MRKLLETAFEARGSWPLENFIPPGKKFTIMMGQSKHIFFLTPYKLTQTGKSLAQWLI